MFWSTRKSAELDFRFENVSIHPTAEVAQDVEIGPFTVVGPHCRIGEGSRLHNNVSLVANTVLGKDNEVFPGAVLGAVPQDRKYRGEESWVIIGDGNQIRECVTIHGGTEAGGGVTRIGDGNLFMAGCHIAHDSIVEDGVTVANNVLLGGHVRVESHVNLGGLAAVHHFVTIGAHAFVAGTARVNRDVPPFMLWQEERVLTINKVGLRRRGFPEATIEALKRAYKVLFRSGLPQSEGIRKLETDLGDVEEIKTLIQALRRTERGQQGRARQPYNVSL